MAATVTIISIGNSAGIVLPNEILARLNAGIGDTLYLHETPTGFEISPYDQASEDEVAKPLLTRFRDEFKNFAE